MGLLNRKKPSGDGLFHFDAVARKPAGTKKDVAAAIEGAREYLDLARIWVGDGHGPSDRRMLLERLWLSVWQIENAMTAFPRMDVAAARARVRIDLGRVGGRCQNAASQTPPADGGDGR